MARVIEIPTKSDLRGDLSVIESEIGFEIKRIFYIYQVPPLEIRGGHAHKRTKMALLALGGSVEVNISPNQNYILDSPRKCLLLNPEDWHEMKNFSQNATLLVLASEKFDPFDYVREKNK